MASLVHRSRQARKLILLILFGVVLVLAIDVGGRFLNSPYNPFVVIPSF
jgi:ABC-type Fe3+-siderophore transport system permease subunit